MPKIDQYECVLKKTNEFEYEGPVKIQSEEDMYTILNAYGLREFAEEHFILITMDSALYVTGIFEVAKGKPDRMSLDVREIFKRALLMNSTIIAVAHNHTHTGKAVPSEEDLNFTEKILDVCASMGVSFADHVIMTLDDEMSMAKEGYIVDA